MKKDSVILFFHGYGSSPETDKFTKIPFTNKFAIKLDYDEGLKVNLLLDLEKVESKTLFEIPELKKQLVTSTFRMFRGDSPYLATPVTKVVLKHSNVTNMGAMFNSSRATTLDLSNFNTSNVTSMYAMFYYSKATSLDLSSFDTSKVTDMRSMFRYSNATTGYARTQADADKFNASSNKPAGLNFVVKP